MLREGNDGKRLSDSAALDDRRPEPCPLPGQGQQGGRERNPAGLPGGGNDRKDFAKIYRGEIHARPQQAGSTSASSVDSICTPESL
jgi:hypothetical protein